MLLGKQIHLLFGNMLEAFQLQTLTQTTAPPNFKLASFWDPHAYQLPSRMFKAWLLTSYATTTMLQCIHKFN